MFEIAGKWIDAKFIGFRNWLDVKLVPTWRVWWKLWSMRLGAVGAAILTYMTAVPDAFQQAIDMFPPWLKDSLPVWVGPLLLGILFFARFWDQSKKLAPAIVQAADDSSDDDSTPMVITPVIQPAKLIHHGAE